MKTIATLTLLLFFMTSVAQDKIYVHTATAANITSNWTVIDIPAINGNPNAGVVYVHTWNPNGLPSVYNNNVTGLWYDGAHWTIYNEDSSAMTEGSHYMVYVADDPNSVITHVSNAGNQGSFGAFTTVIDNPLMNGLNPGPYAVMSHYFNPNGVYNPQNFGFYYDTDLDKRGIYDENATPSIPDGAAFKILINGQGSTRFTHIATAGNISGHTTTIDNAALNGNPNATFVFNHYWGVNGATSQVDLDAVTSVYYSSGFWRIYCEDQSTPILENTTFDIIVAPQEILGVEDNQINTTNISMYPNPAKGNVNFSSSEIIENITIYNILGQKIMNIDNNMNNANVDISALATGAYLAKVISGEGSQTLQFIKE